MKPRLICIHGPMKGATFAVGSEDVTLGRALENTISIQDRGLSRHHCVVSSQEEGHLLRDLKSTNGTLINGIPVRERVLKDGDQISISDSVFVYALDTLDAHELVVIADESPTTAGSIFHIEREDALRLQREGLETEHLSNVRQAQGFNTLLKINTVLCSVRGLQALEETLLDLIFDAFPADRGAIIRTGDGGHEHLLGARRNMNEKSRISRTILEASIRRGTPILCRRGGLDIPVLEKAPSLTGEEGWSILCAPLNLGDQILGAIYLEDRDGEHPFDEHHLKLLTAIAAGAAAALDNAKHVEWLAGENRRLELDLQLEHNMIGRSPAMENAFELIARVAPTDTTVLITGESGTGKELAARAIHRNSPRAKKPFVAINCATLTDNLLESELFGHEKGAFTGAVARKLGRLETAEGGTVLLDEVSEMPPALQAKLLRFLQEREFERLGGTRPIRTDVRIVSSTNRDLETAIRRGDFREDLYYRLNVVHLKMPPLRSRRGDIDLLADHFVTRYSKKCGRRIQGISAAARKALQAYQWPGNVRELQNAMERAVVMSLGQKIVPEDLPEALMEATAMESSTRYHDLLNRRKEEIILEALEAAGGNFTEAATALGIHRTYLHRLIRNLNLNARIKS